MNKSFEQGVIPLDQVEVVACSSNGGTLTPPDDDGGWALAQCEPCDSGVFLVFVRRRSHFAECIEAAMRNLTGYKEPDMLDFLGMLRPPAPQEATQEPEGKPN